MYMVVVLTMWPDLFTGFPSQLMDKMIGVSV